MEDRHGREGGVSSPWDSVGVFAFHGVQEGAPLCECGGGAGGKPERKCNVSPEGDEGGEVCCTK